VSVAQLSAASTERHDNLAPLQLSALQLSAVTTERRRQLSAVFFFFVVPISSTQRHINSALIQIIAASIQR
jgi:hypothetical protein